MELEKRFAHLLKPIRDLAKNWEIDIASQLEDYLDQIDAITITFDNGATSMNFAEAAMVIQGSACVYSKKVEYLYSMVYRVLDLLASKKKLAAEGASKEGATDGDEQQPHDQEEEFLTLDDIREHNNIDTKDHDKEGICNIPRTPMALTKLDETEKGDNPLISAKGEVLANRYDFKMNISVVHNSAMMLLDMSHLSMLEVSLLAKPSSTPFHPMAKPHLSDGALPPAEDIDSGHEGHPADVSMDDNAPDLDLPQASPPRSPEQTSPKNVSPHMISRRQLRERRVPMIAPAKPVVDPWQMLDPHDPLVTVANKPCRKAKTFKMPTRLESDSTKKRKRKKDSTTFKLPPISEFSVKAYYSACSCFPTNPLKIPFPEFEPLYWKELQRRQQQQRTFRKQMVEQGRQEELAAVEQEEREETEDGIPDLLADADEDDEVDLQMPDIPRLDLMEGADPLFPDTSVLAAGPVMYNSYEELVRKHVEGFMVAAQEYAQTSELIRCVSEWEKKIIPKLEEEDMHELFDIHTYGTRVMEAIPAETRALEETVPFKKVVQGKKPFQVCRLFLATLQLANTYNVEISADERLEYTTDTMAIKFLSTRRHHEELQGYQAPSIK